MLSRLMASSAVAGFPPKSVHVRGAGATSDGERSHADTEFGFFRDVVSGFGAQPKTLPCKYLYDARGSELFERICDTEEYYVTRTELELLSEVAPALARLLGPRVDVLEPGSGAAAKIRLLLAALEAPRSYTPMDISPTALFQSSELLKKDYPELQVAPLVADFTRGFPRAEAFSSGDGARLIFFPGSTIGNFGPLDAVELLRGMGQLLRARDWLLIGVDRLKDVATLEAAYDDADGVTAEFNLNLLHRIRRELPSDLCPENFRHQARFNAEKSRVEMHLVSLVEQTVRVGRARFGFAPGESIHTENSHKYTVEAFTALAGQAGFALDRVFSDPLERYSLYLLSWRGSER